MSLLYEQLMNLSFDICLILSVYILRLFRLSMSFFRLDWCFRRFGGMWFMKFLFIFNVFNDVSFLKIVLFFILGKNIFSMLQLIFNILSLLSFEKNLLEILLYLLFERIRVFKQLELLLKLIGSFYEK